MVKYTWNLPFSSVQLSSMKCIHMAVHTEVWKWKPTAAPCPRNKAGSGEGNEQTAKTSWGPKSSSNTTLICPQSCFPLAFCSAKSFSPLGHSLSFFKKNFFPGWQVVFVFENFLLCRFWPWLWSKAWNTEWLRGNKRTACSGTKQTAKDS